MQIIYELAQANLQTNKNTVNEINSWGGHFIDVT